MAEDTKKRNARQRQWQLENMERHQYLLQKGTKEKIVQAANKAGLSYSQWVQMAIDNQIKAENKAAEKDPE